MHSRKEVRRPRVMLLGPSLSAISGVSTHLLQIFNSNLKLEFDLIHFQTGSEGRHETPTGKVKRFFCSPLSLAWSLIKKQPHLVHFNTSIDRKAFLRDYVYFFVAKILGKKTVYQIHGGHSPKVFSGGNKFIEFLLKSILLLSDAVVVLTEMEKASYEMFIRHHRLVVIPNAIDVACYRSTQKKIFDSNPLRLVYIGRLIEEKGVFEIIEAFHLLQGHGLGCLELWFAGSGTAERALQERVSALQLAGQVRFLGPVRGDQKMDFWRDAHLLIFPTYLHEGLPYSVLESLAAGTPMVTTPMGGIPEAVTHNVHGLFVELPKAVAIAEAVQELVMDRGRLQNMSEACIQRASTHYELHTFAMRFSDLYRACLE